MPPPTPVPQKTPSRERNSLAAPSSNSASVATLTSLPIATGTPNTPWSTSPIPKLPSQSGRLRALDTAPVSSSITPGEPTPIAASSPGSTPAVSVATRSAVAIAATTSAGPPVVGVGARESPSTLWSSSTIATWILVPPRSMPPSRLMDGPYPARMTRRRQPADPGFARINTWN